MTLHDLAHVTPAPVGEVCPRHSGLDSLLVRVGNGDRDAFAELYDQVSQSVYATELMATRESGLAADVTQDVFLEIWCRAGAFDPRTESAWAWVRSIAGRARSNHARKEA